MLVGWSNVGCRGGEVADAGRICPHALDWWYTPMDASLGAACQAPTIAEPGPLRDVQAAMRKFLDQAAWVRQQGYRSCTLPTVSQLCT